MTLPPVECDAVADLAAGYVLGALEPGDAAAVRAHLETCERPHLELAELGGVVPYLALAADPIEPADALRGRIIDGVRRDLDNRSPLRGGSRTSRASAGARTWPRLRWAAAGLAVAIVIALGVSSAFLAGRLGESQAYAQQAARAAAIAAEAGSRSVSLSPTAGTGPTGTAVVAADGGGVVIMDGLSAVTGGNVYEVWVIPETSGRPVPAGALHLTSDGHGWLDELTSVPPGAFTVALTREPGPGATTPTLPILASGT